MKIARDDGRDVTGGVLVGGGILLVVILLLLPFWVWPQYRVWQKELAGEAQLREAEWNRQIAVREAQATLESAVHLANAEIERARGVAEANRIIAAGLGGPQGYLQYLWIQTVKDSDLIYVPTEAQLPLLEAGRFVPQP
jgi:hypothetical protein